MPNVPVKLSIHVPQQTLPLRQPKRKSNTAQCNPSKLKTRPCFGSSANSPCIAGTISKDVCGRGVSPTMRVTLLCAQECQKQVCKKAVSELTAYKMQCAKMKSELDECNNKLESYKIKLAKREKELGACKVKCAGTEKELEVFKIKSAENESNFGACRNELAAYKIKCTWMDGELAASKIRSEIYKTKRDKSENGEGIRSQQNQMERSI
ncbi:hypothetical protein BJ741DRAFT_85960 [Chytriomyces cf. hyalinus JEL632]|nr:hypothetical protein BJ741DRAFT_85960 [Chytriomyces cf. hyalinus JEL632]